ncbi:MAG: hypothetical protein HDQ99_16860 [Lachnospiraceae bacterium]|nr:hypothetical protein [Lachnospiraceae bacterium]
MEQKREERIKYPKNNIRRLMVVVLAFAGAYFFPWMLQFREGKLGYTNSMIAVGLFVVLAISLNKAFCHGFAGKNSRWFLPAAVGVLFSFCMVSGAQLDSIGSVPFSNAVMWIAVLVLAVIVAVMVRYFWELLETNRMLQKPDRTMEEKGSMRSWLITTGVILLCYIPVFLAVWPGFFVYDAQDELMQVITRNFSTHHPLLHVLLMGGIVQFGYKVTDSYNVGIALYTFLQMTFLAGIFAWCVEKLKSRGVGKYGKVLLTLYFGLCPVLVMFSLCSAKDGLFTGMLLIMVLLIQELCREPEKFLKSRFSMIVLAGASLGMLLLRHNGFYAFLVFAPFLIVYLKKCRKKIMLYLFAIVLVYGVMNSAMTWIFHADSSENQEILTVPIMQLTRVYTYEKDRLSEEEKEILYQYLSEEALGYYVPKVSDSVKIRFNNEAFSEKKAAFFALWAKWGLRYPFTYLNAWFLTSYGYWYPDTVIDVYRGNEVFTFTYGDSSYFGYEVEEPGCRESKIPWLNELYRKMSLEIAQQKIPVVSMLFSPGFLFWTVAFMLGFICYTGEYGRAVPFVLPLLYWLTVILGPTYLVRYVVFLWVLLPVLLWEFILSTGRKTPGAEENREK